MTILQRAPSTEIENLVNEYWEVYEGFLKNPVHGVSAKSLALHDFASTAFVLDRVIETFNDFMESGKLEYTGKKGTNGETIDRLVKKAVKQFKYLYIQCGTEKDVAIETALAETRLEINIWNTARRLLRHKIDATTQEEE